MKKLDNEIKVVGIIQPDIGSGKVHLQDYVYSSGGGVSHFDSKRL